MQGDLPADDGGATVSGPDPIDGLLLIAATRRAAYRAKPPKMFLDLLRGRLATMFGFNRSDVSAMLPDGLAAKEDAVTDSYDLPPSHYAAKTRAADQLCSVILFYPAVITDPDVKSLIVDECLGHALGDILMATRAFGEPLAAKVNVDDLRHFVGLHQDGECWPWYAGLYAQELKRLLRIEAAFKAALM